MGSKKLRSVAYIDASNLFYGGEKSLGWKVDYRKLKDYLKSKYGCKKCTYFGGVEIYDYPYDYLKQDAVPIEDLYWHLMNYLKKEKRKLNDAKLELLTRHLARIKFYRKLATFGFKLHLKPVKTYHTPESSQRKANCDVEMAFFLMLERDTFDRIIILSGDGDFLPVLKYLRKTGKEVCILARGKRTAREIRQFAGSLFVDFTYLKFLLQMKSK